MKRCSKCKETKPLDEFYKSKVNKDGKQSCCKACSGAMSRKYKQTNKDKVRAWTRKYQEANPEKRKENRLKWAYGITLVDYNSMFVDQNGCCAICKRHQSEFNRSLAVDHNHSTGEVRGLLCDRCNTTIGMFSDSDDLFASASRYLKKDDRIQLCHVVDISSWPLISAVKSND